MSTSASPPPSNPAHQSLAGKKVLVMGLGRFGGGVGVSQWLVSQGAHVTVTDAAPADQLAESLQKLEGLAITYKLGGHDEADFLAADLLIINPAVDKAQSPPVQAALQKNIPYTTEINLFLERCPARTIGITGSVGKSTTTALVHEALKAGLADPANPHSPRVFLGGNIGRSLLLDLPAIRPVDFVILELSSFMLEDTPRIGWSPNIAIVTNVFPNHLDRHGTMAAYSAAKQNILRFQKPADIAILNNDHDLVSRWANLARGKVVKFTTRGPAGKIPELLIPGEHNRSNAAAALALLDAIQQLPSPPPLPQLDHSAARSAISQFPGLEHRLQLVHTLTLPAPPQSPPRTLRFYNDSKATSPDASSTALRAFPPDTAIFIVGGYDKHIDMSSFETLLAQHAAGVVGIGQTGQALITAVHNANRLPADRARYVRTLEEALTECLKLAAQLPQATAIVLSPGSASWDQFPNYEKRGAQFAQIARSLIIG